MPRAGARRGGVHVAAPGGRGGGVAREAFALLTPSHEVGSPAARGAARFADPSLSLFWGPPGDATGRPRGHRQPVGNGSGVREAGGSVPWEVEELMRIFVQGAYRRGVLVGLLCGATACWCAALPRACVVLDDREAPAAWPRHAAGTGVGAGVRTNRTGACVGVGGMCAGVGQGYVAPVGAVPGDATDARVDLGAVLEASGQLGTQLRREHRHAEKQQARGLSPSSQCVGARALRHVRVTDPRALVGLPLVCDAWSCHDFQKSALPRTQQAHRMLRLGQRAAGSPSASAIFAC